MNILRFHLATLGLKDIHIAKKKRQHIIRHQINHCFLDLVLSLKTNAQKSFQDIELPI